MSKLDQFASAFKSASRSVFEYQAIELAKVLVVTDLSDEQTRRFVEDVRSFLGVLEIREQVAFEGYSALRDEDVGALLSVVEASRPDLICCYRNLHGRARRFPFSLGAHVDVLTQAISTPVLLLPAPTSEGRLAPSCEGTKDVMVLTDHLTGSDKLINHGVRFTESGGALVLSHLEDDSTFERYLDIIGKIPALDTDVARERIRARLLKEPSDYIGSVREVLAEAVKDVSITEDVRMGHRVADCRSLVADHAINLVVMNTKDDDQLAMHGLAYPLAVELRDVPLLLL